MVEPQAWVEVVYATAREQHIVALPYAPGLTAEAAVERSGLLARCPELAEIERVLGVFGRRVSPMHRLQPGDRVEICRPLAADPREMRRKLAARGDVMGKRDTGNAGR